MSYCRLGFDSDVYCYSSSRQGYVTHCPEGSFVDLSLLKFRDRLLRLRSSGLQVPDRALQRIEQELAECLYDPTTKTYVSLDGKHLFVE